MAVVTIEKTITPSYARKVIDAANIKNRRHRQWWIDLLASIITQGKWVLTHQGIAFYEDGRLADGQHRLLAIINANCPVKCLVTTGLSPEAIFGIDQGIDRDAIDIGGVMGTLGNDLNHRCIATARVMMMGFGAVAWRPRMMAIADVLKFADQHAEAILFASCLKLGLCNNAVIRGVIGRAHYTVEEAVLERFASILAGGVTESRASDGARLLLRLYTSEKSTFNASAGRAALYAKASSALRAFVQGRQLSKLSSAESEVFTMAKPNRSTKRGSASAVQGLSLDA